ncbi:hypothetical protein Cpa01nite_35470 [Cellulomonas pakistanensis]|uniref:Uncharacterized protein n=1 Tax=Cellulomonas pakistanensis TaxID=992287 RepID=A0A919PCW9_9CELL|nr:hypothetical protein Cpa01nite_35470 [Cellulomonas pakistanensis]
MGRSAADQRWDAAIRHVTGDSDGGELRTSQALWARALRAESPDPDDVRCAGDVLGPVRAPGGHVVMRPFVAVRHEDPQRALEASDAAWRRFARTRRRRRRRDGRRVASGRP